MFLQNFLIPFAKKFYILSNFSRTNQSQNIDVLEGNLYDFMLISKNFLKPIFVLDVDKSLQVKSQKLMLQEEKTQRKYLIYFL